MPRALSIAGWILTWIVTIALLVVAVIEFSMAAGCAGMGARGAEAGAHATNAALEAASGNVMGAIGEGAAALAAILGAGYAQHRYTVRAVNRQRDARRKARGEMVECLEDGIARTGPSLFSAPRASTRESSPASSASSGSKSAPSSA